MLERSDTMSKKKQEFDITGMHCAACVKRVENVVSKDRWCRICKG